MRTLTRNLLTGAALVLLACLGGDALAQTPADTYPANGDEEYVGDITWNKTPTGTVIDINGTWYHMTGYRHKAGVGLQALSAGGAKATGIGPAYEFMLARFPKGALWVGGDLLALGADAADAATMTGKAEVTYELYVGKVAALRVGARWRTAINEQDPAMADDLLNGYTGFIGIGLFVGAESNVY